MPIDTDGLWETYHHIEKLAELGGDERGNTWDQDVYGRGVTGAKTEYECRPAGDLCQTAMCFAGWYAQLHGAVMNMWGDVADDRPGAAPGIRIPVAHWVGVRAGLSLNQKHDLFSGANDLDDLADTLVEITGKNRR